jgi:large subunit ribosomal protein L9
MDVILLQRVEKLGQMGDVVKVRPGFARNFLLPQKKAVRATEENRRVFEQQRAQLEADNLQRKGEAESVAARMDGLHIMLIRQAGESGQLYGSVSPRDIADGVTEAGFTVGRQQVQLNAPIKTLGVHHVAVGLHPEVVVKLMVNVARSAEEADVQRTTGAAVSRGDQRAAEIALEQQLESLFESDEPVNEDVEKLNEEAS